MQKKILGWMMFVLVTANLAIVAVVIFGGRDSNVASGPMPDPNGYADLVEAGKRVIARPMSPDEELSQTELRAVVGANSDVLTLARAGLKRECKVPVEYSLDAAARHTDELSALKALGRLFRLEAQLAELERRTNDAAQVWVDMVELGQDVTRGGLLIDGMVGVATERVGLTGLKEIVDSIEPEAAQGIHSRLVALEKARESIETIIAHERRWSRRAGGLSAAVAGWLRMFSGNDPTKSAVEKLAANDEQNRRQFRAVILDLEAKMNKIRR